VSFRLVDLFETANMFVVCAVREARTYVVRQFLRSVSPLQNLPRFALLKRHNTSDEPSASISTLDDGGSRFLRLTSHPI
jgi:hypothetical protein